MTPADRYRVKAAELMAQARLEATPTLKHQLETWSLAYLRLSEQAERNSQNDVVWCDSMIDDHSSQRPVQQQQQPQSDQTE